MNKLFISQEGIDENYRCELEGSFQRCRDKSLKIELPRVSMDFLLKNSIDVVISNGLTEEWYLILKGLKIVTITIDELDKYHDLANIVIDYKSRNSNRYFTGQDYSICKNKDLAFEEIANLITRLDWDSEFWGFPVAYLSSRYLTESIIFRMEKAVKRDKIRLIEYLCNCHDNRSVEIAEKNGFHFTDIRLSFEKDLNVKNDPLLPEGIVFGRAKNGDIPKLKEISKHLYKDSRYFFDNNFDRNRVYDFYECWIERAVLGQFDDECYCLYDKNTPFGFCSIKYNISNSASIGLFCVSKDYQGKGFGVKLLYMMSNMLADKNIAKLFVVTQGRNYAAQRLYQRAGFLTKTTELWYHKWV